MLLLVQFLAEVSVQMYVAGGQKALVAVALLLAQQMASGGEGGREGLLLLDEPDSALDETHARHLAEALLNSTRNLGCQIILTTLRSNATLCFSTIPKCTDAERSVRSCFHGASALTVKS